MKKEKKNIAMFKNAQCTTIGRPLEDKTQHVEWHSLLLVVD